MAETLESVEAVLGADVLAKLRQLYASGKSIRSLAQERGDGDGSDDTAPATAAASTTATALGSNDDDDDADGDADVDSEEEARLDVEPYDADDVYDDRSPSDLAVLCRSAIAGQRVQAMKQLTRVMRCMHVADSKTAAGLQKLPRGVPLLLRCALDDGVATMAPVALEALLVFLVRTRRLGVCVCCLLFA